MNQSRLKIITICFSITLTLVLIVYFLHISTLVSIIRTSDLESSEHRIAIQLLFKSYDFLGEKVSNKVIEANKVSESDNLLRTIGVIGDKICVKYLIKEVTKYSKSKKTTDNFYYIASIHSLSLAYNKESVALLEEILRQRHNSKHELTDLYFFINWCVARGLYVLTGERYAYNGRSGKNVKVPIILGLQSIREIVGQSAGTVRNYNQMLELYNLTLPIDHDKAFYSIVKK